MIVEYLSFTDWKTKKELINELASENIYVDERLLRKQIETNNKFFAEGIVDYYIIHSCKGYKKTFSYDDIKKSIADNRKRAITMLIQADRAEKQMLRNLHERMM